MLHRALFLANRNARSSADLADHAIAMLRANDIEPVIPEVDSSEGISQAIISHASKVDRVIIVGGDGSINAALAGLIHTHLPLGVIPAGTANDLARTLGLPTDVVGAVEVIAGGKLSSVDVATVNDKPFINAASMGLSVHITRNLTKPLKRRWGPLAYVLAATKALAMARAFHATIRTRDGETHVKTVQLLVGNGKYFGGGMVVDENAAIDDATLHLYSVGVYHWWSLVALLPSLRRGTTQSKRNVFNATDTQFTITTTRPRHITADGEMITQTPATFSIMPGAISIYVPESDSQATK